MNVIIHHPGKAGEVLMALPAARLLKTAFPDSSIRWVVLDLYRESLGRSPYIDEIDIIPTTSCRNLAEVSSHMSRHRWTVLEGKPFMEDLSGVHLDLYHDYIIEHLPRGRLKLNRKPFYLQMLSVATRLCRGVEPGRLWTQPEWIPTQTAEDEGHAFEKRYGGGRVIFFSPFVADRTAIHDNASRFDMDVIFTELRKLQLPVVVTGTKWDEKLIPEWAIDGYDPALGLGGLFWLIRNRAALVVTPNSGIGFASHWLGAPTLMIDNRTGWKKQVADYKEKYRDLDDNADRDGDRWPMFMKENFPASTLLDVPFEQIVWSEERFRESLVRVTASGRTSS
jgi:ADP-heptose:LPS heptosyltransferase